MLKKKLSGVSLDDRVYAKHGHAGRVEVGATSSCNGARQAAARALGRPLLESRGRTSPVGLALATGP
jgi:hypothetical protein